MCIKNKKNEEAEKLLKLFKERIEELSQITCTLFLFINKVQYLNVNNFFRRLEEICGEFLIQTTTNISLLIENKEKLKARLKKNDISIETLKVILHK